MGVPGLWEFIKDTGEQRSFAQLAIKDGFEGNKSCRRAYRIGIDVSIWLRHSYSSKEGENPQLWMLLFRLSRLAELPLIPLFVFDGNQRPKAKRGSKMGKSGSHPLNQALKEMIEAFGMESRVALGEAEAELAYLNSKGYIDAILTDDCDAFVFGGRTIIKNWSATLSDNMSDAVAQRNIGSNKRPQVTVYSADRIHDLSRGGLILYALLQGGDYHEGVPGLQAAHSFGLARCGFGDSLLREYNVKGQHILPFLVQWREEMNTELASNSWAFIPKSKHRIPKDFPDLKILEFYVNPISSATNGGGGPPLDKGEMSLPKLARFCEEHFEWAYSQGLIRRFRELVWPGAVMHVLRRAALEADAKEREKRARSGNEDRVIHGALKPPRAEAIGTPAALVKRYLPPLNKPAKADRLARIAGACENRSQASRMAPRREGIPDPDSLITSIVGTRRHGCTDNLLEYHVEVCPVQLVALTKEGIKGFRGPPREPARPIKKPPPAPHSILRLWIPGSILHQVHPGLVEDYALKEEVKASKEPKGRGKRKADESEDERGTSCSQPAKRTQLASATRVTRVVGLSVDCAHAPVPTASLHAQLAPSTRKGIDVIDPWSAGTRNTRFLFTLPDGNVFDAPATAAQRKIDTKTSQVRNVMVREDDLSLEARDAMVVDGRNSRSRPAQSKDSVAYTRRWDAQRAGAVKRRKVVVDAAGSAFFGPPVPRRAPRQLEPSS